METENRNNKKQENKILPEIYNKWFAKYFLCS
jgi:hypothetical protein